ncbi:envelope glycoprotein GP340/GP220 [Penicillium lividum]|nr:envelope glycoprotein GP340/GP220 [Penicillium lividum]
MRVPSALLALIAPLAFSTYVQARKIDVCTQVTRNYVTNGDFTTDSDWTSSVSDYTIITPEESDSTGYFTFVKPSNVAPESSKSPASVTNPGPTSVIASSAVLSSKTRNNSGSLEPASSSPEALPSYKSTSTLPETVPTTQAKPQLTTSTIFTTSTRTVIACPSTITNCPVNVKTTYVTTETIVVSTTIYPVTEAEGTHQTTAVQTGNSDYTSTVLTTREITITSCAATVTDCPARSQTTFISTQTLVAGTTVIPARETASNNLPTETGVATTNPTTGLGDTAITASAGSGEVNPTTATTASPGERTSTLNSSNLSAVSSGIQILKSFTEGAIPTSAGEEEKYQTTATASNMAGESGASSIAPALTISDESPTLTYAEGGSSSEAFSTACCFECERYWRLDCSVEDNLRARGD